MAPRSWSLSYPAAVAADSGPDAPVAAHYGQPLQEQRRWLAGQALVDRSHHGVLQISGAQRLEWLNGLLTQDVGQLPPGQATQALILSPHGHIEHHLRLVDDGQRTWILTEPGDAGPTAQFLTSMIFRSKVEVDECSEHFGVVSLHDAAAMPSQELPGQELPEPELLQQVRQLVPVAVELRLQAPAAPSVVHSEQHLPASALPSPAQWVDAVVPLENLRPAGLFAPEQLAGLEAFEAWRVMQGLARLGVDTDHRSIPHEMGWVACAVALNKGCYRGQETVARVQNLGRPPRRLVRLLLDGSPDRLPASGALIHEQDQAVMPAGQPLDAEESQSPRGVGFVGTRVRDHECGPVALALVKRNVPVDATLSVEQILATQEVVVEADRQPAVQVPRLGSLASRGLTGVNSRR